MKMFVLFDFVLIKVCLSQNGLSSFPMLPSSVTDVNVSHNLITHIPVAMLRRFTFTSLDVSHNHIKFVYSMSLLFNWMLAASKLLSHEFNSVFMYRSLCFHVYYSLCYRFSFVLDVFHTQSYCSGTL